MVVVKRLQNPRPSDNGLGLLMLKPERELRLEEGARPPGDLSNWYRLKEADEASTDDNEILCAKWSKTLLLGSSYAATCIVRVRALPRPLRPISYCRYRMPTLTAFPKIPQSLGLVHVCLSRSSYVFT